MSDKQSDCPTSLRIFSELRKRIDRKNKLIRTQRAEIQQLDFLNECHILARKKDIETIARLEAMLDRLSSMDKFPGIDPDRKDWAARDRIEMKAYAASHREKQE